jgi:uncharacterized protein (DUF486 family)
VAAVRSSAYDSGFPCSIEPPEQYHWRRFAGAPKGAPPPEAVVVAILLLLVSNVFMTLAWYGHLKFMPESRFPLALVVVVSWGIALFEYCFQVPANRIGYRVFSATQLKIFQEVISISVFIVFALLVLQERPRWNHGLAFLLIGVAAALAVRK